ncbi:dihydrodipicolinate synthase family protein [Chloroflexota bacterium]
MLKYEKKEAKKWVKENLTGCVPTMTTVFTEDEDVDYEGMRYNFRNILKFDAEGYAVNAMAGEVYALTKEEKKNILELAVEEAQRNKVRVITSVIDSLPEALERVKHAEAVGADAVWLSPPMQMDLNEEGVIQWYKYIADRVNIALAIFNIANLGPGSVARLAAECPNIVSLKTCPPLIAAEVLKALREANTEITLFMPMHSGFVCVLAGMIPPEYASYVNGERWAYNTEKDKSATKCWELAKKGELVKAAEIFYGEPLVRRRTYFDKKFRPKNTPMASSGVSLVPLWKYWWELLGLRGGPCRLPLLPPTAEEKLEVKAAMIELGYIEK